MGSLRNPIGPLPSSIYWRRRAVAFALAAVLLLIAVWVFTSGGGDGDRSDGANKSSSPASSITPGPKQSGPAISRQPGGRDEPGATGGSGTGGDSAGSEGSGSPEGSGGSGSDGGTGQTSGSGGGTGGTGGTAERVPAGSSLPNCPGSALALSLAPTQLTYAIGEKPAFRLTAVNSSATDCKVDLGRSAAVLTVTDSADEAVWSSDDCPRDQASVLLKVPAHRTISHTYEWDRARSTGQCATPPASRVGAGTYLLEAKFAGETVSPASFVLAKD
ncbi:hypothetical protein [Streptomyces qinzhouensis]|uniref:DUF4232 domain-containing protein n=1 Tax=Streptomyces qinzhouensis TaxID=2599401 RepID=A0A5B8JAD2_9ACTN|nr:hypothetical protein [Streptomyces qinzhouensis]QDY78337.1 hypothetical protein FQU76_19625 [Streptomyces qinzhouensis]